MHARARARARHGHTTADACWLLLGAYARRARGQGQGQGQGATEPNWTTTRALGAWPCSRPRVRPAPLCMQLPAPWPHPRVQLLGEQCGMPDALTITAPTQKATPAAAFAFAPFFFARDRCHRLVRLAVPAFTGKTVVRSPNTCSYQLCVHTCPLFQIQYNVSLKML